MPPPLTIAGLRAALRSWDLHDADLIGITPGATAEVFLVLRGGQRWVAKYGHDTPEYFEVGLRASEIVHERLAATGDPIEVATPVRTTGGALTELVAGHPLAVLTFVRGDPLRDDDPEGPALVGDVCGRVHAALLDVTPGDVGLPLPEPATEVDPPDPDAGEHDWLNHLCRAVEARAWATRSEVRHAVSVWDGPDVRRRPDGIGVLDFGHCSLHALVHVVANRSLNVALTDETRIEPFLAAVERHLPLTAAEHEQLTLHRVRNAAIYARWVATEKVARREPGFNDTWFRELVELLRREAPRLGDL